MRTSEFAYATNTISLTILPQNRIYPQVYSATLCKTFVRILISTTYIISQQNALSKIHKVS